MSEVLAQRAMREAVELISSRRLKHQQGPLLSYVPQARSSGGPRLLAARRPVLGTIGKVAQQLEAGQTSCKEMLEDCLATIERDNWRLNAFAEVTEGPAREQTAMLDEELATQGSRGLLHGIPISIQDVIDVKAVPTRAGSATYGSMPVADAASVARLRAGGAVVVGKATTHEFGLGVTTPQTKNPHNVKRVPGGASGGSAVSVATGMVVASLGSDTRSSIRIPAALSGVVGFKPTFGLVPVEGMLQSSWSMGHIGPLATSVPDAALLLDLLASSRTARFAGSNVSGLRVGTPPYACLNADPGVLAAFNDVVGHLAALVASVRDVARPNTLDFNNAVAAGLIVSRCEAAAFHRRLGLDRSKYWPETRDQLDAADRIGAADYLDAQRLRSVLAATMMQVFDEVDVLAMPTSLVPAPPVEEAENYLLMLSRNTVVWSLVGFPAISIPCGMDRSGLPVGLQLIAPPREEATLVALGTALESTISGW